MKNRIRLLVAALVGASALAACNSLEVTMPVGPQGEQGVQGVPGKDGLSAYELWVKAIQEKQIDYESLNKFDSLDFCKFEDIKDDMIITNNGTRFVGVIKARGEKRLDERI